MATKANTVNRLAGKVGFLAGATSGIGQATAEMFASEGARVIIAGRRVSEGQAVVDGIRQQDGEAIFVQTDVTEPESVERAIRATIDTYGRLDVLFNNAGGSTPRDGPVTDAPLDEFWRAVEGRSVRNVALLSLWNSGADQGRRWLGHQHGFDGWPQWRSRTRCLHVGQGRRSRADALDGAGVRPRTGYA